MVKFIPVILGVELSTSKKSNIWNHLKCIIWISYDAFPEFEFSEDDESELFHDASLVSGQS